MSDLEKKENENTSSLKKQNNKNKSKENKHFFIVILILLMIFLIAFLSFSKKRFSTAKVSSLTLDPINVTLQGKDNKNHSVNAQFSITGKGVEKLDKNNLTIIITNELKNFDYNELTSLDGDKKLKQKILEVLKKYSKEIENIYLKNLTTDIVVPDSKPKSNKAQDYLKGFRWNK